MSTPTENVTKQDWLTNKLRGERLWDILWDAIHGESVSHRGFGGVQRSNVQSTAGNGVPGFSTVISATAILRSGGILWRGTSAGG